MVSGCSFSVPFIPFVMLMKREREREWEEMRERERVVH